MPASYIPGIVSLDDLMVQRGYYTTAHAGTGSVTFPKAYDAAPIVTVAIDNEGGATAEACSLTISNVTTTGFDFAVRAAATAVSGAGGAHGHTLTETSAGADGNKEIMYKNTDARLYRSTGSTALNDGGSIATSSTHTHVQGSTRIGNVKFFWQAMPA